MFCTNTLTSNTSQNKTNFENVYLRDPRWRNSIEWIRRSKKEWNGGWLCTHVWCVYACLETMHVYIEFSVKKNMHHTQSRYKNTQEYDKTLLLINWGNCASCKDGKDSWKDSLKCLFSILSNLSAVLEIEMINA